MLYLYFGIRLITRGRLQLGLAFGIITDISYYKYYIVCVLHILQVQISSIYTLHYTAHYIYVHSSQGVELMIVGRVT